MQSCTRSECLSRIYSSRGAGLKPRICFSVISSPLLCGERHLVLRSSDRALLIWMTQIWPSLLGAAQVVQPETILRWHRTGLKAFWRWKSRNRVGRPKIDRGLRDLIQRMSRENPLWGASRIHGELLIRWPSRRSRNIWRDLRSRRRKPGRLFCKITLRRLPPSICALCRR